MKLHYLKLGFTFLLICTIAFCSFSQDSLKTGAHIKLIKWSAEDCDNMYNPDLLKSRITRLETHGESTFITVNFSDNCCAEFKPAITFSNNRLILLPYETESEEFCFCDCCFSIEYEISGLPSKEFEIYFKTKKVELSENYYAVVEPTDTLYKGKKINRINKYNFKEGLWITFYKNGQVETISKYPEEVPYFESFPLWSKGYYISGIPSYNTSTDTLQTWFEDGEVKSQFITYKKADTTYKIGLKKFDDRKLERRFFERSYPTVCKSTFSSEEEILVVLEIMYQEEYYSNGKPKLLFTTDTTYEWYENGQLKSKTYKSGEIKFNEMGNLFEQRYEYKVKRPKAWSELTNLMCVQFYENSNIKEIHVDRYELVNEGKELSRINYRWKWDKEKKLIIGPKKWRGKYPWEDFKEINLSRKVYGLN